MEFFKQFKSKSSEQHAGDAGVDLVKQAACVLLLEIASSDDHFSESENMQIRSILEHTFNLNPAEIDRMIHQSREKRKSSVDLWEFTNQINALCSSDEKMQIMENLWRIVYADGKLDKQEDYLLHKLSTLLRIPLGDMIAMKMKVKRSLNNES